MPGFNHDAFVAELRRRRGSIPQDLYDDVIAAIEVGLSGVTPVPVPSPTVTGDPVWLAEARKHIGTKEIVGPQNNNTILGWVKFLGGWFKDDETPWCGTFMGFCFRSVGIDVPKNWFRAKEWASWGVPCNPTVGAVAVFGRKVGGHVAMIVGESLENYYVLGGNQGNMVNIIPIAKNRAIAIRWPSGHTISTAPLPKMSGGVISRNEA